MKRLSLLFTFAVLLYAAPAAYANGHNQVIFLAYMPDVSNYGNQNASGIAVVDLNTGEVSVQATGLTAASGVTYQVWLAGPNQADPVYVAPLEADGHLPTVVVTLPQQDFRYVLLTAETGSGKPEKPGKQVSLVGLFPNPQAVAPVPGVGSSGQPVETPAPAATLPETGALLPDSWVAGGLAGLGILGVVATIGIYQSRRPGGLS